MSAIRNFALAALAAAALAGSAQAQSTTAPQRTHPVTRDQRGEKGGRGNHMGMFRGLNLTDAQKTQIKAIHAKYEPQLKASREQEKPYLDAARAARQKGDTAGFRTNMEKARQVSSSLRQQEMNEINAVLTPEQRAKATAAMQQRQERGKRGGKRGDWRKGRGPKSGQL